MRKCFLLSIIAMVLVLIIPLSAGNLTTKGRAWLDANGGAAAVDVSGVWYSKAWGKVVLHQAPGSRELTGRGDVGTISGVVVGEQVLLLFSQRDKVLYSAKLMLEDETTLSGSYAKGIMNEKSKSKSMHLTKQ